LSGGWKSTLSNCSFFSLDKLEKYPLKLLVLLTWIFIIILIYKSVRRYGDERWKAAAAAVL
jgi:hypothetical protein